MYPVTISRELGVGASETMTKGRLTKKQREIKDNFTGLIYLIVKQSGNCEYFDPSITSSKEIIGGIASSMVEDLEKEKPEDVRRAYDSLTR